MECLTIRGRELILPKLGGTSTWARGENLAAPWLHGPQPISHYPVGLGFPHPEGRYRPEGSTFSSPGFSWFRDMELFLTRGGEIIAPRFGGISAWARGETLGTYPPRVLRDLNVGPRGKSRSQSSITQRRWGFHTLRGGVVPVDLRFLPRTVRVVEI